MLRLTPSPSSEVLIFLVKMFLTKKIGVSNSGDTSPLFMKFVHKKSFFPREAPPPKKKKKKKKRFHLGQSIQIWVYGVGWSQTFINHCFSWKIWPVFVENFRLMSQISKKSWGVFTSLGQLSQIKPFFFLFWGWGVGGTSLILYYSLMLMHIKSYLR